MRLAIDCFKLVKGAGKSIGIYNLTNNLVRNLVRYKTDETVDIYVFGTKHNKNDFDITGVNFVEITDYDPLNKIHAVMWELFYVSSFCKKFRIDSILFPRGYCALRHPAYDMIIIHDLIPFYYNDNYPGYFNRLENMYIMNRLKASAKTCKKIISISEYSKKDIIRRFSIKEDKILVIHNGVNNITEGIADTPGDYICAVTSPMPHKNAAGVVAAYKEYCNRVSNPLKLVIIGIDDISDYYTDKDLSALIICHKYIKEDRKLHEIIKNSRVFLFLSYIEGFGFPPIEAMQLDVPVICSNTSSLPEIVRDCAVLVDPDTPEETADAIIKITNDREYAAKLITSGKQNVKRFSWETQAKLYWDEILNSFLH